MRLILQGICPQWLVRESHSRHDPRPEYVKVIGMGQVSVTLQGRRQDCNGLDAFLSRARNHTWDAWAHLAQRNPVVYAVSELWEDWR